MVGDTVFSHCQTWLQEAAPEAWLKTLAFLGTLDVDYSRAGSRTSGDEGVFGDPECIYPEWVDAVAAGFPMPPAARLKACPLQILAPSLAVHPESEARRRNLGLPILIKRLSAIIN